MHIVEFRHARRSFGHRIGAAGWSRTTLSTAFTSSRISSPVILRSPHGAWTQWKVRHRHRWRRGIGKAITLELAREGVDVAIVARDPERLARAATDIAGETGVRVLPFSCDVRDRSAVEATIDEAAVQLGGLHILVNSGSAPGGSRTAVGRIETIVDEDFLDDFKRQVPGCPALCPRGDSASAKIRLGSNRQHQPLECPCRRCGNVAVGAGPQPPSKASSCLPAAAASPPGIGTS